MKHDPKTENVEAIKKATGMPDAWAKLRAW